jgi:flagellar motility protein MotE (MotC chaperone)
VTEEQKETKPEKTQETPEAPAKNGGIMKMIMFAAVGLVAVVAVAFGALMFLGEDKAEYADSVEETTSEASHSSTGSANRDAVAEEPGDQVFDSLMGLDDESAIEQIMSNLAFLDYEPDLTEAALEQPGMSVEDSIESMNWLEKEKAALTERERELTARQRDLEKLDREVTQKILRIEQAETARIAQLARLYDGMESKAVAKLMANLDDNTVVSIIPRMKVKNASIVLSMLPSKRAAKLSKQMITIAEK